MVSLECGQVAKGIGVRNVFPSSCGLSPGTFLRLRSNRKASDPGDKFLSFPYKRLMRMCRWMRSHFHAGLTIMGSPFQQSCENGVAHFEIFWAKTVLHIYG